MAGYTRNDTPNNIADGNVINASDLDGEFDAVQAAFNGSTGHSHDGSTGNGPQIAAGGIASNAVTTAKILDANVTTAKIADNNVTTAKILDANVTLAKMAANSVDSDQYVDGSIDTDHIGDLQVTTAKIAADAIDGTKIADDVIDSEHYVAGSIDAEHLASNSVTSAKLDTNIQVAGTLGVTGETTLTTHLNMGDNDIIKLGDSADLQIYHDGASGASYIAETGVSNLILLGTNFRVNNAGNTQSMIVADDGGKVQLHYAGSGKLETTNTGIDVTGVITTDGMTTSADINFGDNNKAIFGAGSDLQIYHTGTESIISDAGTGNLKIYGENLEFQATSTGETYFNAIANGAVTLYYDNAAKLATKTDGVDITGELQSDSLDVDGVGNISGTLTMGSNVDFPDGSGTRYGASNDLQIYHDGSDSYVNDVGTGALILKGGTQTKIQASNGENGLIVNDNGAVWLYYDNSTKLETASTGVDVTGDLNISNDVEVTGRSVGGTPTAENDGSFDLSVNNDFTCTTTANTTITFTNAAAGQSGNIKFVNASNHTITADTMVAINADVLSTLSVSGTYHLAYYVTAASGTDTILVSASAALT